MQYTSGLAKRLHYRSMEEVIAYPYFMKSWQPQLIKEYLGDMAKENLMVFL